MRRPAVSNTLKKSWSFTEQRFERRNSLEKRGRVFCGTPLGRKATSELFLSPLADFMAGRLEEKPNEPPRWLRPLICDLDPAVLALMALAPLLNGVYGGWDGDDTESAEMFLRLKIGTELRDRLALEKTPFTKEHWSENDCVRAGHWLMQCALSLSFFTINEYGYPEIAPEWQEDVDQIREDLLRRDPVLLPHDKPPPDWTGPVAKYDARLQARFV